LVFARAIRTLAKSKTKDFKIENAFEHPNRGDDRNDDGAAAKDDDSIEFRLANQECEWEKYDDDRQLTQLYTNIESE
jgi:hypothetical protein